LNTTEHPCKPINARYILEVVQLQQTVFDVPGSSKESHEH